MKKSFWIKLCVVVVAISMILSMAACNPTTPEQTTGTTEETHEHTTESNKTQTTETETDGTDTTETDGKDTTETEAPVTTESEAPVTTESEAPVTTESEAPVTTESEAPATTESEAPVTTETEAPATTESEPKETEPKETEPVETQPGEDRPPVDPDKPVDPEPPVDCKHEAEDEYTWEYSDGEHWQICVHCEEPFNKGAHDLSGEWQSNGRQHWKECPVCEEVFQSAEHKLGDDYITDGTHHWKECEVCHEEIDKDTHLGLTVDNGDGTHSKQCNLCGEKYADAAAHVFGAGTMGVTHKCECGATEPCTVGLEFGTDETHHWSLHECEACGMTTERVEHLWAPGEDGISRKCEICNMVQTCDKGGDHFEYDEDGHWYKETCEICGITEDELNEVPHVYDEYGHKSRTCTTCGYTEVCTKNHYEMDETSHKLIEICDICQITQDMLDNAEAETHDQKVVIAPVVDEETETEEETEDNGLVIPAMKLVVEHNKEAKTTTYKHVCPTCSYVYASRTISEDVNYYSAPGQVVNAYGTSDNLTNLKETIKIHDTIISDEDGTYTRVYVFKSGIVSLTNGTVKVPTVGTHAEAAGPRDELSGGLGKYLVFRIRTSGMTNVKFNVSVKVDGQRVPANGMGGSSGGTYQIRQGGIPEFTTFVVEVAPNADATHIQALLGHADAPADGAYMDIAYFAVCSDWAEVENVVGEGEKVQFMNAVTHTWINATPTTMYSDGSCNDGAHTPGDREANIQYVQNNPDVCYTYDVVKYACSNPQCSEYNTVVETVSTGNNKAHDTEILEGTHDVLGGTDANVCYSYVATETCKHNAECGFQAAPTVQVGHKSGAPTLGEDGMTYACTEEGCGKTVTLAIPAGVNYFSAPGQVLNLWATGDEPTDGQANSLGGGRYKGHGDKPNLLGTHGIDENGAYTRVYLYKSAQVYLTNGTADRTSANYYNKLGTKAVDVLTNGLGQFAVFKIRTSGNTDGTYSGIKLSVTVEDENGTVTKIVPVHTHTNGVANTDGFVTYVVDLSAYANYAAAAADAKYVQVMIGSYNDRNLQPGAYIDVAYFAICDSWEVVEDLVGENNTVKYTADWTNATIDKKSNGDCVTCTPGTNEVYKSAGEGEVCYYYDLVGVKCTNPDCPNYNVVDESAPKQENLAKEHAKVTTPGTPNYNHGLGADVCYTTTATVTCSNDGCQYTDSTTTQAGHDHSDLTVSGTTYSYACKHEGCQKAPITFTISEDVNYFSAPGQFVNHWMTSSEPDALTNFVNNEKTLLPHVSVDADGTVYTRVYSKEAYSRVYMSNGTADPSEYRGGTDTSPKVVDDIYGGVGKYVVVKLRLSDNADGNVRLEILTDTMTTAMFDQFRWVNKDGAWHILVVELPDTVVDKNASKINVKIREPKAGVISYIDIAYFGICDNWAEVESIVGEGKSVSHMTEWSNNATVTTKMSDGGCANGCTQRVVEGEKDYTVNSTSVCYTATTTTYKCNKAECPNYNVVVGEPKVENGKHALVEDTENGGWKCSDTNCNRHFDTTTAATGVNYYSAPGQVVSHYNVFKGAGTTSSFGAGTAVTAVMADENGLFTRMYMGDGGCFMVANGKQDGAYAENAPIWTIDGGMGRYLVLKLRANGVKAIRFGLKKTDGTNTSEVISGGWANNWRTNVDEYGDNEFTTYIIDLGEAAVDSTTTKIAIEMGTGRGAIGTYAAGGSLDIAYVAICDNWSEVASVVGIDDVVVTTWGNGTNGLGNGSSTDTPMTNAEVQAKIAE